MQQVGGFERVVQLGRDPGGVPDDQRRQQGAGVPAEPVGGLPQPGAQPPGGPLREVRAPRHPGRDVAGRPEQRHGPLPLPRRGQPGRDRDPDRGLQPGPLRMPGQHPDRGLHPGAHAVGARHPGHHRVQHHHGRPAPAPGGPGIGAHGELHHDPGVLPGQPGHRPRPRLGPLQPGHPRPGGRAQQRGRHSRAGPPPGPRPTAPRHQQHPRDGHRDPRPEGTPPGRHPEPDGRRAPRGQGGAHQPQVHGPAITVSLLPAHRRTAITAPGRRRTAIPGPHRPAAEGPVHRRADPVRP